MSLRVELFPLGKTLNAEPGEDLLEVLFENGVEFPCGGRGLCKGCKVRVLEGAVPIRVEDQQRLSPDELASGWRLACRLRPSTDLKLEVSQWDAPILTDDSHFDFTPSDGVGVAVDIGTTTIAAQLVDLRTAQVLAVRTALNAQARHGADIMSRIEFAVTEQGQPELQQLIREQVGALIGEMMSSVRSDREDCSLTSVVLVGNTVMHHLFCGISVEPLSQYPFEPISSGLQEFDSSSLKWNLPRDVPVRFLPCIGGFVGSDILAGILATRLHESESLQALIDLGTNGEIVVGNRDGLLCASTAAGPAFEGARISMGMRAATGAISEVHLEGAAVRCHVIGKVEPRGICGSGLVDAVAAGLELGTIRPNGRLAKGESLPLVLPVALSQWDIRELQLAKGAIAAGCRVLLQQCKAEKEKLTRIFLAGAFGNYIRLPSACRIGLLDFATERVVASGNTALLGAKLALFADQQECAFESLLSKIRHVSLNEDPDFQERYAEEMLFPASSIN